jgi:hypothetical protein
MKYLLPEPDDPFTLVNHPWQPFALHLHVLAGPLFLLAVGMILRGHILARLVQRRRRPGRWSGLLAAGLLPPMVGSGYLLQTVTAEEWRRVLLLVHLGCGFVFAGTYLAHVSVALVAGRRRRMQGRNHAGAAIEAGRANLRTTRPAHRAPEASSPWKGL